MGYFEKSGRTGYYLQPYFGSFWDLRKILSFVLLRRVQGVQEQQQKMYLHLLQVSRGVFRILLRGGRDIKSICIPR